MTEEKIGVLIIDDAEAVLKVISSIVEHEGMEAVIATSASQALQLIETKPNIRVAMIDFTLLEGRLDLVDEVSSKQIKPIIMSGYDEQDCRSKCGNHPFLRKPFDAFHVRNVIRVAILKAA